MMNRFRTIFVRKKPGTYNYVDDYENSDGLITELIEDEQQAPIGRGGRIEIDERVMMDRDNFEMVGFKASSGGGGSGNGNGGSEEAGESGGRRRRILASKRFTRLEKRLIAAICVLSLFFTIITIYLTLIRNVGSSAESPVCATEAASSGGGEESPETNADVCMTRSCVRVSEKMIRNMNSSADPCDDFYEYACGGWINSHELTGQDDRMNLFSEMGLSKSIALKKIMERTSQTALPYEMESRKLYKLCLNTSVINQRGSKPLLDFLSKLGKMPALVKDWDETSFDFNTTLVQLAQNYIFPFFYFEQMIDPKNSSQYFLTINQPKFFAERKGKSSKDDGSQLLESRVEFIADVLRLLGADNRTVWKDAMGMVELEEKVVNITQISLKIRDYRWECAPLDNLTTFFTPAVDWQRLFTSMYATLAKVDLRPDERVCSESRQFLGNLTTVIATTSKRTMMNYMLWSAIEDYVEYLDEKFLDVLAKYIKKITGANRFCRERWMRCVEYVQSTYYVVISNIYIRENFKKLSKDTMDDMVSDIKAAFVAGLDELSWMNDDIRGKTAEKADYMKAKVGYPAKVLDPAYIKEYYKGMETAQQGFFEEIRHGKVLRAIRKLKKLRKKVEEENAEWMIDINAYFSSTENTIDLPAGILQPPLFIPGAPYPVNYGGIGVAVGHELTHGFDDQGVQFDKFGNRQLWWDNATMDRFQHLKTCMVDQYGRYEMLGEHLDGNLTIGENIADNGGLRIAYQAYRKRMKLNDRKWKLPSLDYTADQLFFISSAQTWCSIGTDQVMIKQILNNPHSPGKYRVIGMMSNFDKFSRAFGCKRNSRMNPADKCKIW